MKGIKIDKLDGSMICMCERERERDKVFLEYAQEYLLIAIGILPENFQNHDF